MDTESLEVPVTSLVVLHEQAGTLLLQEQMLSGPQSPSGTGGQCRETRLPSRPPATQQAEFSALHPNKLSEETSTALWVTLQALAMCPALGRQA